MTAQTVSSAVMASSEKSLALTYLKPSVNGKKYWWNMSWPVAFRVVMVRPWKESFRVMMVDRPSPYLSKLYFRASLMMPSLASAPEFPKKTALIPVRVQSCSASFAQGSV